MIWNMLDPRQRGKCRYRRPSRRRREKAEVAATETHPLLLSTAGAHRSRPNSGTSSKKCSAQLDNLSIETSPANLRSGSLACICPVARRRSSIARAHPPAAATAVATRSAPRPPLHPMTRNDATPDRLPGRRRRLCHRRRTQEDQMGGRSRADRLDTQRRAASAADAAAAARRRRRAAQRSSAN